jgi:signal-transduction protein with cAMP-binding, CBS, and nucleotidyltransferase domain
MADLTIASVVRDKGGDHMFVIPAATSVAEAVEMMVANEIGAVLVMTEDGLVGGIFTERDLLVRVVQPGLDPGKTPLSLVMTRDVRFVSPGTTIEAALALMHVQRHRHLLVMDGPRVHGLVSMRDLAYHLIRHGEGRFESALRAASQTESALRAASQTESAPRAADSPEE